MSTLSAVRRDARLSHEPASEAEKTQMSVIERNLKKCLRVGDARPGEALEAHLSRSGGFTRSLVAKTFRQRGLKENIKALAQNCKFFPGLYIHLF